MNWHIFPLFPWAFAAVLLYEINLTCHFTQNDPYFQRNSSCKRIFYATEKFLRLKLTTGIFPHQYFYHTHIFHNHQFHSQSYLPQSYLPHSLMYICISKVSHDACKVPSTPKAISTPVFVFDHFISAKIPNDNFPYFSEIIIRYYCVNKNGNRNRRGNHFVNWGNFASNMRNATRHHT